MIRCLYLLTFYVLFLWFTIRSFWSCFLFDCIRGKTDQRPKIRNIITIHFAFHRPRHIYNLRVLAKQTQGLSIVRNGRLGRIVSLVDRGGRNMVDHFLVECGIWIKMTEHIAACSHWFIRLLATSKKYINIHWGRFKRYSTGVIGIARYGDRVEFSHYVFINKRSTWQKSSLIKENSQYIGLAALHWNSFIRLTQRKIGSQLDISERKDYRQKWRSTFYWTMVKI